MYRAINLGFCAPIKGLPTAELFDTARFKDDKAVGIGLVATGLMYNTKVFKEKGWAPPTSWNDLKDPKYKGQLVIPPIKQHLWPLYAGGVRPHEWRRGETPSSPASR